MARPLAHYQWQALLFEQNHRNSRQDDGEVEDENSCVSQTLHLGSSCDEMNSFDNGIESKFLLGGGELSLPCVFCGMFACVFYHSINLPGTQEVQRPPLSQLISLNEKISHHTPLIAAPK
jgi:hypothetical protein